MAKIDLVNNEWVDLIFEGRNQAYGAYKLRKGTSSRNVKSILIMLAMAALAFIAVKVNNVITEANKKVAVTTVQELSALEKPKEKAEVKQKKADTCMKHFGVDIPAKDSSIQAKIEQTCLDKYGVKCQFQRQDLIDKSNDLSWEHIQKWKDTIGHKSLHKDGKMHYTHQRLRAAMNSQNFYLPYLFTYQREDCKGMPNTNNKIEGTFTDLKKNLNNHSGLTIENRKRFISGFFLALAESLGMKKQEPR